MPKLHMYTHPRVSCEVTQEDLDNLNRFIQTRFDCTLYQHGFAVANDESHTPLDAQAVQDAILDIRNIFQKTRGSTPATRSSSYGGKHVVEEWRGRVRPYGRTNSYLSNGHFIAACVVLGVAFTEPSGPNCNFALRRLEDMFYQQRVQQ